MAIGRVNFEPVSSLVLVERRDYPLADPQLANPVNALALIEGEWLTLVKGRLVRASNIAQQGDPALALSFPLWAERGRYDIQAIAGSKVPILFMGQYEADTRVFDAAAVVAQGAAITRDVQPLKAATITVGGRSYCGLVGHGGAADPAPVVGHVTRLPAQNGGRLRFRSGGRL
jgi:hypothetical protein